MIPGEIYHNEDINEIPINRDKKILEIEIENTGDRTVQIGSHYHFYEINESIQFDREKTKGYRLNIAAGMSIRLIPNQKQVVQLVEYSGSKTIVGFQGKGNI